MNYYKLYPRNDPNRQDRSKESAQCNWHFSLKNIKGCFNDISYGILIKDIDDDIYEIGICNKCILKLLIKQKVSTDGKLTTIKTDYFMCA